MVEVLVLYYSRHGATAQLARAAAQGIESLDGVRATLRTVPAVASTAEHAPAPVPATGAPYATLADLERADALMLGSPCHFGVMAAPLKHFIDSTSALWLRGALSGKPAAAFTSSQTPHGGQESTLLGMLLPLLHHGMYLVGLPFTESKLESTRSGGSPYGATHVGGNGPQLSGDEQALARALGRRVAELTLRIAATRTP